MAQMSEYHEYFDEVYLKIGVIRPFALFVIETIASLEIDNLRRSAVCRRRSYFEEGSS